MIIVLPPRWLPYQRGLFVDVFQIPVRSDTSRLTTGFDTGTEHAITTAPSKTSPNDSV